MLRASMAALMVSLGAPGDPVGASGDYVVYSLGADQTVTTTDTKVSLDTPDHLDAGSYSAASGTVTVTDAGLYLVIAQMSADRSATGTDRSALETTVRVNGSVVAGTRTDSYIRRITSDAVNCCAFGIYSLAAGDTLDLYAQRLNGSGSDCRLLGSTTTYNTGVTAITVVRLDDTEPVCIVEALVADNINPATTNGEIDVPWSSNVAVDEGFAHSETVDNDEINLDEAGRYLVVYSDSYSRVSSSSRTNVYARLKLDGADVAGSWSSNYTRGAPQSLLRGSISCATIVETSSADQKLKLTISTEGGNTAKTREHAKARMVVYKLPSGARSFKVGSTSTENIGSTTDLTLDFSSSEWIDAGYSLVSNQVTVANASPTLLLSGVVSDPGNTDRVTPWQRFYVDGAEQLIGTSSAYARNVGGMEMTANASGAVFEVGGSQTVDVRSLSRVVDGTANPRVASTGAFCGLDLASL